MAYFSSFWYKHYKELRNCCMTEPLLKYPLIREGKKVPADLQGKLIRDLIDIGWMSEQGLKWFGWDVDGWYAWTDSNGMIHRIRDLKRNENGKRFEKEVTNIVRGDEPRDDIFASAHQLYQHELDLSKDCQLCPIRVVEPDDTEETTDNQGTKKEVDVIAPPWQTYAGGNPPVHGNGPSTSENENSTPPSTGTKETTETEKVTETKATKENEVEKQIEIVKIKIDKIKSDGPKQLQPGKPKPSTPKPTGNPKIPQQYPPFEIPKPSRPPVDNTRIPPVIEIKKKYKPDCKDLIDAANMAQDVYNDGKSKLSGGWKKSTRIIDGLVLNNDKIGYSSELYERKSTDGTMEYAYVYRGSDDIQDWVQNLTQNLGLSLEHELAVKNAKILNGLFKDKVKFIGHSLGGGLASIAALDRKSVV